MSGWDSESKKKARVARQVSKERCQVMEAVIAFCDDGEKRCSKERGDLSKDATERVRTRLHGAELFHFLKDSVAQNRDWRTGTG